MKALPVLQSGFVGLNQNVLILPDPSEPTARQSVIFKEFKPPLMSYFYSKEVTELFNSWSANKDVMRNFEFRERLIKTAFESFGCTYVSQWLHAQINSKQLSMLHSRFILETLEYIVTGEPRRMSNIQWLNLLEAGDATKAVHAKTEDFLKVKTKVNESINIPSSFSDLIIRWTSRRTGFEDLLICLYVVFGARSRQTNVIDLN